MALSWYSHKHFPKSKLRQQKIKMSVNLSTIGIIHYNFLEYNQSTPVKDYGQQLDKMHIQLNKMHLALVNGKDQRFKFTIHIHMLPEDDTAPK